ncbi:copper resistance CopC family protein, partial [Kineococcus indalonis]|uniref:copper resistance CopC family protein n=1 Tax=Kineococcus indalonis TaxID=2696566 RepID=UPI001412EFB8
PTTAHRAARAAAALALALGAGTGGALALAPAAAAHDRLVASDPADGAALARAPERVVLTMSAAPVGLGTQVQVTGPTGVVSTGEAQVVDETVAQALTGERPAGTYEVRWRVTSSDGHPISGSFTFDAEQAVAAAGSTAAPTPDVDPSASSLPPSAAPSATADEAAPAAEGGGGGTTAAVVVAAVVLLAGAGVVTARRRRG